MIERPVKPESPKPRGSAGTLIMVIVILGVGSGILLVLPTGFIGPVMVFGGLLFFGMIAFHYVLWGRWLTRLLREEALRESDNDQ